MKSAINILFLTILGLPLYVLNGQSLPERFEYKPDDHRLIRGNQENYGFYSFDSIDTIFLQFDQSDYWTQLSNNYEDKIELLASFEYKGINFDSVGVRFKGQTSYFQNNSEKKSFNITLDHYVDDQDIEDYGTINLNNAFGDPSYLREILYLYESKRHLANAKGNYKVLMINGESWGLYINVQQLDKRHVEDWFLDEDATRWRAERTTSGGGGGPGGPPNFGAGTSSLNYLGEDTADYFDHYTLKSSDVSNPWHDLVNATYALNESTDSQLVDSAFKYMDVDAALWFAAHEIVYSDDDGYVNKGGMDYYVYYDIATERLVPIEYDGNSCMNLSHNWSPFYRENNADFPLMNVLLENNALRQRYLAHVRTILAESFDEDYIEGKIDHFKSTLDNYVLTDPQTIYGYSQFENDIEELKTFFSTRLSTINSNSEVQEEGLTIDEVVYFSEGVEFNSPEEYLAVQVQATVVGTPGVSSVILYYGTGFMGHFQKVEMFDDGNHQDGIASDGIYGADIPGQEKGVYVRYYVEAVSANTSGTRSYSPPGAEHDVYTYRVKVANYASDQSLVINELMSSNTTVVSDLDGEYDDWIEIYNKGSQTVDLSGYFLTDDQDELSKWEFPEGTELASGEYLTVWMDKDTLQAGLHANFKLSGNGEIVILLNENQEIIDEVLFNAHITDESYSRMPNGTGGFDWQGPSFGTNNEDGFVSIEEVIVDHNFILFPNPASDQFYIKFVDNEVHTIQIFNIHGQLVYAGRVSGEILEIEAKDWAKGMYLIRMDDQIGKLILK